MESLGWRQRRGSRPAARRGARQRAGLTPVSASNTLSCERETPHPKPNPKTPLTVITVSTAIPRREHSSAPTAMVYFPRMAPKETTLKEIGEILAYVVKHMATKDDIARLDKRIDKLDAKLDRLDTKLTKFEEHEIDKRLQLEV